MSLLVVVGISFLKAKVFVSWAVMEGEFYMGGIVHMV